MSGLQGGNLGVNKCELRSGGELGYCEESWGGVLEGKGFWVKIRRKPGLKPRGTILSSIRMKTCWTPGFPRGCFLFQLLGGRTKSAMILRLFTQIRCWRLAMIYCSFGWRGWLCLGCGWRINCRSNRCCCTRLWETLKEERCRKVTEMLLIRLNLLTERHWSSCCRNCIR